MKIRPIIALELTKFDRVLEGLCLIILILLWIGTIAGFSRLPEKIPSHFDAAGQADDYSNKRSIFTLPIVATILYIGMTIINRYPQFYNYPAAVTAENARRLYTSAARLIRSLKLAVVVIFSAIVLLTYKSVFDQGYGLGQWFLPAVLVLIFVPTIVYLINTSNSSKLYD